jgi:hypothetical protein
MSARNTVVGPLAASAAISLSSGEAATCTKPGTFLPSLKGGIDEARRQQITLIV